MNFYTMKINSPKKLHILRNKIFLCLLALLFLMGCNQSPKRIYEYKKGYILLDLKKAGMFKISKGHIKIKVYDDWVEFEQLNVIENEKAKHRPTHWVIPKEQVVYFGE